MKKRAIIYARISETDSIALDLQKERGRIYALENGMEVVQYISEMNCKGGISPLKQKQLISLANQGFFDVLVVCSLDRLIRDPIKTWGGLEELQIYGVQIISLMEGETEIINGLKAIEDILK